MKQKLLNFHYSFLRLLTKNYLRRTKPIVIWVTWSVGKTWARMIIAQVLEQVQNPPVASNIPLDKGEPTLPLSRGDAWKAEGIKNKKKSSQKIIYTSPQNFNSELGLIFSIFQIESYAPSISEIFKKTWEILKKSLFWKKPYDIFVAEYGIDSPWDMDTLLKTLWPDIVVLTKLDSIHSENFPDGVSWLWREKWKLPLAARKKVYFNSQDAFSQENTWLLDVAYDEIFSWANTSSYTQTTDAVQQTTAFWKKKISLNLIWEENAEYTLLGLNIARDLWISLPHKTYDFSFIIQPGRQTIFKRGENIFIDSSYNAWPESMKTMIHNTMTLRDIITPKAKLVWVFGDMREIWQNSATIHQEFSEEIKQFDVLFLVGPQMYQYALSALKEAWFTGEIHASLSSRDIWKKLKKYLRDDIQNAHVVLVKWSQNTIFTEEALAPQLTPTQQKNLPRQSESWQQKKDKFFQNV